MAPLPTVLLLTVAALDLSLSFAHLVEGPPRLWQWSPALWRDATVFNGQFALFAPVGGVLEIATILGSAGYAAASRHDRRRLRAALVACTLFALGLVVWLAVVAPANAVLATWTPGPLPADFEVLRTRWEGGHAAIAIVKLAAFAALAFATQSGRLTAPAARTPRSPRGSPGHGPG
ncbi:DUF1772 domain-containing protein [uncultured Alsobacter sp.]|uniref:DUF1772 domain-containing protein n=1 Tax=uncultured Alsobacter sp. TaxID=1748258 RepID=UPI0025D5FDC8|nr:DUF1772 domain-containing protein [uncultured Alsobacter sp.]